jgi:hypothetical protein
MSANGASCQELQIALKNRFHTKFLDKGKFIIFHRSLSIACFQFSFVQVSKLLVLSQYLDLRYAGCPIYPRGRRGLPLFRLFDLYNYDYSGNTIGSPIEAPLISREVLPETYFLLVIMAADAQAGPFLQFQASCSCGTL